MKTLIKNAAVVFCDGVRVSDILIKNGKIADTDYKGDITENTEIIDADGNYLLVPILWTLPLTPLKRQ